MALFGKPRREQEEKTGPHEPYEQVKPTPTTMAAAAPTGMKNSVVGKTLFIKGNIFSDEEVFIEGRIEGKLNIKHRVIIGKSGVVNADIEAHDVVIKGTVNGNVKGNNKVEIIPNGVLNGNIFSPTVKLSEGAVFKGSIDMTIKEKEEKAPETQNETGEMGS